MSYNFSSSNIVDVREKLLEIYAVKRDEKRYFSGSSSVNQINKDTLQKTSDVKNTSADGKDDGKISFKEKIKNFGIGLISPIKKMFSSPKNIAITAASIAGGAALIALTGGAAAPVMVALGIAGGGIQIGKGIYKQANAKTDNEAQQAWQQMGTGTFTVGVSAAGAKASLKASGASNVKDTSFLGAAAKCFKSLPSNISKSVKTAGQNISGIIGKIKSPAAQTIVVETPAANPSSSTKPPVSEKPIIDIDFEIVDAPESTVSAAEGVKVSGTASHNKTPALIAGVESPKLTAKPKPLQLEAKPEPLKLEAPKTSDVTVTDSSSAASNASKTGLLGKIKNMLKPFGFFTSEK